MTAPILDEFPWSHSVAKLKAWFAAYLLTISAGWTLVINSDFESPLGLAVFFGALIPYIGCIVHAYRVQDALNRAKLYKGGAWQIIAGALLLNPFALGFVIPASVLWASRRVERKIREGKVDYPALAVPR